MLSVGLSGAPVSEKPKAKITEIIAAEKLGLEFATFGSPVLGNKEKYLEDIKLVSKNFQLTGRGLTYYVKEDEEVYDYYHLTLDGLLSPHQTIQEYEGQHDDRLYAHNAVYDRSSSYFNGF